MANDVKKQSPMEMTTLGKLKCYQQIAHQVRLAHGKSLATEGKIFLELFFTLIADFFVPKNEEKYIDDIRVSSSIRMKGKLEKHLGLNEAVGIKDHRLAGILSVKKMEDIKGNKVKMTFSVPGDYVQGILSSRAVSPTAVLELHGIPKNKVDEVSEKVLEQRLEAALRHTIRVQMIIKANDDVKENKYEGEVIAVCKGEKGQPLLKRVNKEDPALEGEIGRLDGKSNPFDNPEVAGLVGKAFIEFHDVTDNVVRDFKERDKTKQSQSLEPLEEGISDETDKSLDISDSEDLSSSEGEGQDKSQPPTEIKKFKFTENTVQGVELGDPFEDEKGKTWCTKTITFSNGREPISYIIDAEGSNAKKELKTKYLAGYAFTNMEDAAFESYMRTHFHLQQKNVEGLMEIKKKYDGLSKKIEELRSSITEVSKYSSHEEVADNMSNTELGEHKSFYRSVSERSEILAAMNYDEELLNSLESKEQFEALVARREQEGKKVPLDGPQSSSKVTPGPSKVTPGPSKVTPGPSKVTPEPSKGAGATPSIASSEIYQSDDIDNEDLENDNDEGEEYSADTLYKQLLDVSYNQTLVSLVKEKIEKESKRIKDAVETGGDTDFLLNMKKENDKIVKVLNAIYSIKEDVDIENNEEKDDLEFPESISEIVSPRLSRIYFSMKFVEALEQLNIVLTDDQEENIALALGNNVSSEFELESVLKKEGITLTEAQGAELNNILARCMKEYEGEKESEELSDFNWQVTTIHFIIAKLLLYARMEDVGDPDLYESLKSEKDYKQAREKFLAEREAAEVAPKEKSQPEIEKNAVTPTPTPSTETNPKIGKGSAVLNRKVTDISFSDPKSGDGGNIEFYKKTVVFEDGTKEESEVDARIKGVYDVLEALLGNKEVIFSVEKEIMDEARTIRIAMGPDDGKNQRSRDASKKFLSTIEDDFEQMNKDFEKEEGELQLPGRCWLQLCKKTKIKDALDIKDFGDFISFIISGRVDAQRSGLRTYSEVSEFAKSITVDSKQEDIVSKLKGIGLDDSDINDICKGIESYKDGSYSVRGVDFEFSRVAKVKDAGDSEVGSNLRDKKIRMGKVSSTPSSKELIVRGREDIARALLGGLYMGSRLGVIQENQDRYEQLVEEYRSSNNNVEKQQEGATPEQVPVAPVKEEADKGAAIESTPTPPTTVSKPATPPSKGATPSTPPPTTPKPTPSKGATPSTPPATAPKPTPSKSTGGSTVNKKPKTSVGATAGNNPVNKGGGISQDKNATPAEERQITKIEITPTEKRKDRVRVVTFSDGNKEYNIIRRNGFNQVEQGNYLEEMYEDAKFQEMLSSSPEAQEIFPATVADCIKKAEEIIECIRTGRNPELVQSFIDAGRDAQEKYKNGKKNFAVSVLSRAKTQEVVDFDYSSLEDTKMLYHLYIRDEMINFLSDPGYDHFGGARLSDESGKTYKELVEENWIYPSNKTGDEALKKAAANCKNLKVVWPSSAEGLGISVKEAGKAAGSVKPSSTPGQGNDTPPGPVLN